LGEQSKIAALIPYVYIATFPYRRCFEFSKLAFPEMKEESSVHMSTREEELQDQPVARFSLSDLFPTLEELAAREETVKVTIALSKLSVEYFKEQAELHHTQYQRMIRRLLDEYVQRCLQFSQES
jgi:predicted DNA binding CopG/RHH family protein